MPFRQALQGLVDKAEEALNKHNVNVPHVPPHSKPPPVPTSSKPRPPPYEHGGTPYWQPTFQPSAPVSTHFAHELGMHGWGNAESQNYVSEPQNSFHTPDNALVIHAIVNSGNPDPSLKYTSARLSSHQRLSRPRGCLSARIRAPVAPGVWPAFWLLPADPFQWPQDGEVDIMEAWDGDRTNHSCLHWGHFNGEDWNKHRVIETPVPSLDAPEGVRFDFVWEEDEATGSGKLLWYIDGRPVMKATKPGGTRPMRDFRIIINIAVGGNVCKGRLPPDGVYELVIRDLAMWDWPPGGWERFSKDWDATREGHAS